MATHTAWTTRDPEAGAEALRTSLAGSLVLHGLVFVAIVGSALVFRHRGQNWGEHAVTAGAIQASMVSSLPLPPRQKTLETGVLTSERPSPAPTPTKERAEPAPSPRDLAIAARSQPRVKVADKPAPEPPKHPQPAPPQPEKATTGETAGIRIAQSTMQLKNGTASVSVEDRTFGARYAYYVNIVNRTVAAELVFAGG